MLHLADPNQDIPARDPTAVCVTCQRTGTWALIVRDDQIIDRYCWRCWPRAHRLVNAREEREFEATINWMRNPNGPPPGEEGQIGVASVPLHLSMAWHWVLAPGTLWRFLRHFRRIKRRVRQVSVQER